MDTVDNQLPLTNSESSTDMNNTHKKSNKNGEIDNNRNSNNGPYRKKAKKQIGAEVTAEDLRGKIDLM